MLMVCSHCEKPILDKYVLTVLERPWHPHCVRCVDCGLRLAEKCFSRDGKIYCKEDFYRWKIFRLNGQKYLIENILIKSEVNL